MIERIAMMHWVRSRTLLILVSALSILLLQWVMSLASRALFGEIATTEDPLERYPYLVQAIFVVIVAPFYETIIFQWILIAICRLVKVGWGAAWLISTLVFAGAHGFIGRWFFGMAIAGGILAGVYILEEHKLNGKPIGTTFLVHTVFNAIVFTELSI